MAVGNEQTTSHALCRLPLRTAAATRWTLKG
jgi:hypothetical protein